MRGELDKLVIMANQIATALEHQRGDAAKEAAVHIRSFWTPAMRQKILDHVDAGGAGLNPAALAALAKLRETQQTRV